MAGIILSSHISACAAYILRKISGAYIDTGAQINLCKRNCLPENEWEKLDNPLEVRGFNGAKALINYKAENVKIQIWKKLIQINRIYAFELHHKDIILGRPFLSGYQYFSKFDCKSGFYHLKLEEESKKLTAFTLF